MKECKIVRMVRGQKAVDGAGVHLVRVIGHRDVRDFDPFLMLDSFDSTNPSDYLAGFPTHPHRGIETITYLLSGRIAHEDSLGNKGVIRSGESQWMTAGSGILHQEMPKASERMLGFQLWLNLPSGEKMSPPQYLSITQDDIPVVREDDVEVRVLSGRYHGVSGVKPRHIPASLLDVHITNGSVFEKNVNRDDTVFAFFIEGSGMIGGQTIEQKTAVLFGGGDTVRISAPPEKCVRFMLFSAKPLNEPVAWGGPIVMNTQDELEIAFDELRKGTFIQNRP